MNLLTNYMSKNFYELNPREFYKSLFESGILQTKGVYEKGVYNGIIIEVTKEKGSSGKNKILRHTLTRDLDKIDEVVTRENFCLMSPISYIGMMPLYACTMPLKRFKRVRGIFIP